MVTPARGSSHSTFGRPWQGFVIMLMLLVKVIVMIMLLLMKKSTSTLIQENHPQQATERGTLQSLDSAARPLNATLEPELWKC